MPLRDHFRRPNGFFTWYSVQGMWAVVMPQHLNRNLPQTHSGYPKRVRKGVDDPHVEEEFALRIVAIDRDDERLVASVEFVSPENKASAKSRRVFVTRCAALLGQGVCVSLVDIVTDHDFNPHSDLFDSLGLADPNTGTPSHPLYAVTLRPRMVNGNERIEAWSHQLAVGQPLPNIPIWLDDATCLPLDLEATYEEVCRTLRLRD